MSLGFGLALLGLLASMLYLGSEVAKPYEGDADRATWIEPGLEGIVITPGPEQRALLPPALAGDPAVDRFTDEEWSWGSVDGRIRWSVDQDGRVTMESVGGAVPWPEVKQRFTDWTLEHDLPAPTFTDVQVSLAGESVPAEQLP